MVFARSEPPLYLAQRWNRLPSSSSMVLVTLPEVPVMAVHRSANSGKDLFFSLARTDRLPLRPLKYTVTDAGAPPEG